MVPGAGCGAIIGKGGETIAKMQKSCGARVKMAKNSDFYPGELIWVFWQAECLSFVMIN